MITWIFDNPGLSALAIAILVEIVVYRRQVLNFLKWLPSEIKAEWNEIVLKLPDARNEKPDYSGWQFFSTLKDSNNSSVNQPFVTLVFTVRGVIVFLVVLMTLSFMRGS